MGENTVSIQKDNLVPLLMALMQWRGSNIGAREIHIEVFPIMLKGEYGSSAYKATITYIDR